MFDDGIALKYILAPPVIPEIMLPAMPFLWPIWLGEQVAPTTGRDKSMAEVPFEVTSVGRTPVLQRTLEVSARMNAIWECRRRHIACLQKSAVYDVGPSRYQIDTGNDTARPTPISETKTKDYLVSRVSPYRARASR